MGCSSTMRVCGVLIYYEGVDAHPKLCNQSTRFIAYMVENVHKHVRIWFYILKGRLIAIAKLIICPE